MNWHDYIHSDPAILVGKPVVKGTRLSVEFLLQLLAEGWTPTMILDQYPSLTSAGLQAVFAFVAECMHDTTFYPRAAA